jgi:Carboxypeptidase regulatory-like domain
MRPIVKLLTLVASIVLIPTVVSAQAVIAGTVKDSSGAVLPGVTVEAASPALIEKIRTHVTDGTGQYRIEDLRPGVYSVTFTLQGFNAFKREGIELTGQFTATINAELKVGTLAETITVTGETPVVDIQSARREMTLNNDVLKAIPTARSYGAMVTVVPGVNTNLNDVVSGTATTQFPIHGGRNNEGRLMIDGLNIGNPPGGNQPASYIADVGNAQEVTFTTAGGLGESETAGLVMNVVPKTGGNSTIGSVAYSGSGEALQSNNYTDELKAQGLTTPIPLTKVYDLNGAIGGPIKKDRIWYFVNARTQGNTKKIANVYNNLNAGDPTKWLYSPDLTNQAYNDRTSENVSLRLTWQATPRNKIGGFWDEQANCRKCTGLTTGITDPPRVSPEARGSGQTKPLRVPQVTWSSPVTNKLLLDAGFGGIYYGWGNFERDPNPTHDLIAVTEQCAAPITATNRTGCDANGGIPGLVYRSQDYGNNRAGSYSWRASASYVTGRQSVKVGYQGTYLSDIRTWAGNSQNLAFRLNNGVPNQLTEYISPWVNNALGAWHAVFVQDQYTAGKLTLQGALRFDHSSSWYPEQTEGPSRFFPQAVVIPETKGVTGYKDITPRMGVAYDLFGNGRTAVKANLGKYLEGMGLGSTWGNANPTLRMPLSPGVSTFGPAGVTRAWTDANNNFIPDCNLQDPNLQDLRSAGGDFCAALQNRAFGTATLTNNFDPALLTGWGVRSSDWTLGASVQQQLSARSSVEIAYTRRWYRGFTVTDNLATANSDWQEYSITAPSDPRLPGGGGYVVSGLYDLNPTKFGQVNNFIELAEHHDLGEWKNNFNGVDVTLNVRLRNGWTFQGGTSTGQGAGDNCEVRRNLPELTGNLIQGLPGINTSPVNTTNPYCKVDYGWLTQFRALSNYVIPKIDVQFSGVFQSKPGPILAANWAAPSSAVTQALGRAPAGNPANVTINLLAPGEMYGDRLNQLDFRVGKIFRFGRTRTLVSADLYNALNSSAVLTYNNAFVPGGTWLQPQTVLTARLIKFAAEITF